MLGTARLYIDLAVVVLVVGLLVFCGWEYDQRKLDADKITAAQATVTQLQQGLTQLQAGVDASNAAISAVAASAAVNAQHGSAVRQRVVAMGNNDVTVQKWLDARLPADGCMLDDTCGNGAAASGAVSSASSAVR